MVAQVTTAAALALLAAGCGSARTAADAGSPPLADAPAAPGPEAGGDAPVAAPDAAPAVAGGGAPAPGGSAGCGQRQADGLMLVAVGGAQQPYLVVLPAGYDPDRPYPLVFYLHGRGDHPEEAPAHSADVIAALTGRSDVGVDGGAPAAVPPPRTPAIVVYPRALSSGWEEKEGPHTEMLRSIRADVSRRFCVDPARWVVVGFSSGGWFTSMIACTLANDLAGVVIASAGLKRRCGGRKPALVIAAIGEPDYGAAHAAAEDFRTRDGCTADTAPAPVAPCLAYQGCAAAAPSLFCPWKGTHQWPTAFGGAAVADFLSRL